MVEVSCGNSRHEAEAARLAQVLNRLGLDGKLLIGYPVLSEDSTEQGVDAVLRGASSSSCFGLTYRCQHERSLMSKTARFT